MRPFARTLFFGAQAALVALAAVGLISVFRAPRALGEDPFLRRTATVRVVEEVGPAVVNITTERVATSPFRSFGGDPFFDRFFGDIFEPRRQTVRSLGSGVLIDAERHVLTNEHVISRASRIRVSLADGREFGAQLVGADTNNDLAVLRVETDEKLPWKAPGSSSDLLVGEPVIAIGNPFGLSNTVTTGVLSAQNRSINNGDRTYHGFLQTDAAINPGNSGGPLLNAEGDLIGVNTAIYQGEGIGFAIPIDAAKRIVAELIEHGEVQPVWLGLAFQDLDRRLHDVLDLPDDVSGVLVSDVRPKGPAERGGVRRGDIIMRLDDHPMPNAAAFFEALETYTNDQKLELYLWRDGEVLGLTLVAEQVPENVVDGLAERWLGMKLGLSDAGGYVVQSVRRQSAAERIGFLPGDRILGLDGRALRGADDFRRAVLGLRGRSSALLVVQRAGRRHHVTIPLT